MSDGRCPGCGACLNCEPCDEVVCEQQEWATYANAGSHDPNIAPDSVLVSKKLLADVLRRVLDGHRAAIALGDPRAFEQSLEQAIESLGGSIYGLKRDSDDP